MEEKIKVGEYVKTDDGRIDKVINPDFYIQMYIECQKELVQKGKILKHSHNIIDLIEERRFCKWIYSIRSNGKFNYRRITVGNAK